jgi:hypothetical protein
MWCPEDTMTNYPYILFNKSLYRDGLLRRPAKSAKAMAVAVVSRGGAHADDVWGGS